MKYEVKISEVKTYYVDVEALNEQGAKALAFKQFKRDKQSLLHNAELLFEVEEVVEDKYTVDDLGPNWW